jgi:hypothetical protein
MPVIATVEAMESYRVKITWREGMRAGTTEIVDISPLINSFAFYRQLRNDPALFQTVHVAQDGNAIGWIAGDQLDMAATAIERLAIETPTRKVAAVGV